MIEGELTDHNDYIIQTAFPKLLNIFVLAPWPIFMHTEKGKAVQQALVGTVRFQSHWMNSDLVWYLQSLKISRQ